MELTRIHNSFRGRTNSHRLLEIRAPTVALSIFESICP
jgi:hypothetical protein